MTQFEYLAIAYSLVISFAVVRAASVLPHVLESERGYWVHTVWVLGNLVTSLLIFWNFWSYREVEWTLGRFALVLTLPTALYVLASILAPDDPGQIQSWRRHYYSVRVRFFVTGIAYFVVILMVSTFVLDMPILDPFRLVQLPFLGVAVAGALSDRPAVHSGLASLVIAAFVILVARSFAAPGPLWSVQ
ncbi:MAG: hypothetical protein JRH01_07600 [Deltaproteobacteria bacterium]|nr:hypothetical protein [Deltaproteobacteria bacterium]MBW2395192.1 hypothetical protein [Deltaproteobacteria bacterium]